jgi:hypothetical protein
VGTEGGGPEPLAGGGGAALAGAIGAWGRGPAEGGGIIVDSGLGGASLVLRAGDGRPGGGTALDGAGGAVLAGGTSTSSATTSGAGALGLGFGFIGGGGGPPPPFSCIICITLLVNAGSAAFRAFLEIPASLNIFFQSVGIFFKSKEPSLDIPT